MYSARSSPPLVAAGPCARSAVRVSWRSSMLIASYTLETPRLRSLRARMDMRALRCRRSDGSSALATRHAEAEPHGARQDAQRRLTERGEQQARVAGRAIARMGAGFESVLFSPKVRARQTAELAGESWEAEQQALLTVHLPLAGGFDARQALDALAGVGADGACCWSGTSRTSRAWSASCAAGASTSRRAVLRSCA